MTHRTLSAGLAALALIAGCGDDDPACPSRDEHLPTTFFTSTQACPLSVEVQTQRWEPGAWELELRRGDTVQTVCGIELPLHQGGLACDGLGIDLADGWPAKLRFSGRPGTALAIRHEEEPVGSFELASDVPQLECDACGRCAGSCPENLVWSF